VNLTSSRRALLAAGLTASFLALVPRFSFGQALSDEERAPIGPNADPDVPFEPMLTGALTTEENAAMASFAESALRAWALTGMETYPTDGLTELIRAKTSEAPSYLKEYRSAAQLITSAGARFGSDASTFVHLMFAERAGAATIATRLGRSRKFAFDQIVRHIVAQGAFRNFGFVNYEGYRSVSFYDPASYRGHKP
jgi:hypothetical protein